MRPPREVLAGSRRICWTPQPPGESRSVHAAAGRTPSWHTCPARRAVPTGAGATPGADTGRTSSGGPVAHTETDPVGRSALRKVAWRLMPFLGVLYFVNYLDRTNIGFAKLTMSEDLGLTETMFGLASGLFFIGYLFFEVPSNLALHRFGARRCIARIMVSC